MSSPPRAFAPRRSWSSGIVGGPPRIVAIVLGGVLAFSTDVGAQRRASRGAPTSAERSESSPAPASADEPGGRAYSELVAEAVREFDLGHYSEARSLFERAHAILPNARTLRGIGMTCFEMRDYPHAWIAFREALANPERPLTSAQRNEVESLLTRTEVFLGRVRLVSAPPDTRIVVDGGDPVLDGDTVVLAAGTHELQLTRPDGTRGTHVVEVIAGRTRELDVHEAAAPANGAPSAEPASTRSMGFGPLPGAVVLGGGGALLVVSLVQGIRARSARNDYDELCARSGIEGQCLASDSAQLDELAHDFERRRNSAWGLFAAGTVTSAVGATLLALGARHRRDVGATAAPEVACSMIGCTLTVRGSF